MNNYESAGLNFLDFNTLSKDIFSKTLSRFGILFCKVSGGLGFTLNCHYNVDKPPCKTVHFPHAGPFSMTSHYLLRGI